MRRRGWTAFSVGPEDGSPSGPNAIAGRVRAVQRRLQNDAGWFSFRGVSDLAAAGYALSGRGDQVLRRFDAYQRGRRTVVRCLGMLGYDSWVQQGLAFSPSTPGYYEARTAIVAQANARGMYVQWCLFADAQIVMPDHGDRERAVDEFAAFCRQQPGVIPQLANEPFKNGWEEADDPALLALADRFAAAVGHRDFSIGDPMDGDDPDSSAATTAKMITLSHHSNIVVLHPDRSYGTDSRFRRWVDHIEGMTDVVSQLSTGCAYIPDEPIGAGLVSEPGRRDSDPDALVAGEMTAACCGFGGYTYHKIDSEIDVADLPGFYEAADAIARVPRSPEWVYFNDGWTGSPTGGVKWLGLEGKMRHLVCGNQAWSLCYGEADWNSIVWRPGWVPTLVYSGPRVRIWTVNQ